MTLLATKLHAPPRREQTVTRERLIERLRAAPGTKLTLVAAPPGSGKTTLLGEWRELEEVERPVAWLTLDEGDDDPVVLWSYVLAALQSSVPALATSTSLERAGAARLMDLVLPDLLNGLTAAGEAGLILDDFHRLSDGPARDSIAWFVDHAPPTFRLIVATRKEPGLPVAALRAHAALLELRASDLAFTRSEAEEFLNQRLALGLEPQSIDGLVERTEGWPAGLYLAALSLQGVEDRDAFVTRYDGTSRHVIDFLVDEVLEAHDAATRELLLRASVLDRFCGSLCDAVVGRGGSAGLLDGLARTNLFLVPLDDRGTWYRFHHLFAQLLRVELTNEDPGLVPSLHRRAFEWYRDQGLVDEAIEQALKARAFSEAGELVAATWVDHALGAGRQATVIGWIEQFPDELLRETRPLLLAEAWTRTLAGDPEGAARAVGAVEQLGSLEAGPLPDGFSSAEASLAALRGMFSRGAFGAGLENARRAAELEGPTSRWRAAVCLALGVHLYLSGAFDEAETWLAESFELGVALGQWSVALSGLSYRSLVAGELGRTDEQVSLADQAVTLAREHGLEEEGEFLAQGAALVASGRLDDALTVFERGLVLARRIGHPSILAEGLMRYAGLLRTVGRGEEAAVVLEEARAVVDSCPDPRILAVRLADLERPRQNGAREQRGAALSDRELRILRMLGGRLSERDIGRELYLSHNTVHSHTKSIYRKLGVSSRSEALQHARELGLI